MAAPFTRHAHTHTHAHIDFILKIHWPNPITHSYGDTCADIHTWRLFTTPVIKYTHSALIEKPRLLKLTEQMVILFGAELCLCVKETIIAAYGIMAGCMSGVNVILFMRLSLIDGQLKSWFPFTQLSAPLFEFDAEGCNSR